MIELTPIGTIHTPFTKLEGMPIQPTFAVGVKGTIEVFEEYRAGFCKVHPVQFGKRNLWPAHTSGARGHLRLPDDINAQHAQVLPRCDQRARRSHTGYQFEKSVWAVLSRQGKKDADHYR